MSEQLVKSVSGLRTRTAGRIAAQNDAEDALDDAARARRAVSDTDTGVGDTPASA